MLEVLYAGETEVKESMPLTVICSMVKHLHESFKCKEWRLPDNISD